MKMQRVNVNKLLYIEEAANYLGVSSNTLRRWDNLGKFKAIRNPMNSYRMYQLEDLTKLYKQLNTSHK